MTTACTGTRVPLVATAPEWAAGTRPRTISASVNPVAFGLAFTIGLTIHV
jgi:1,4-dihydroxy-2-naphthoate octaprenyltransferase